MYFFNICWQIIPQFTTFKFNRHFPTGQHKYENHLFAVCSVGELMHACMPLETSERLNEAIDMCTEDCVRCVDVDGSCVADRRSSPLSVDVVIQLQS